MKNVGALSVVVLGVFLLLAIAVALNGFMLSFMWEWFVVPLGVPSIGIAQAIGIAIIVSVLTYQGGDSSADAEDGLNKILGRLFGKIVAFGIAFGLSFVVAA